MAAREVVFPLQARAAYPTSRAMGSNPTHKQQDDEDDQDDADDTYSAVTVPVAVASEAATEAAKQKDDE
jgi:hypothetical protein